MIVHYRIAAEIARQRQQEIARSVESRRYLPSSRRRWWEPGFLRHPAAPRDVPSPAPASFPATV